MMSKLKPWLKLIGFVLIIYVLFIETDGQFWQHLSDFDWIRASILKEGTHQEFSFLFFCFLFLSIGGPRQLIAFGLGFIYGEPGIFIALLLLVLSASLVYLLARTMLYDFVMSYFSAQCLKMHYLVRRHTFTKLLMIRLLPLGNNLITNLIAGAGAIRFIPFICASGLGYLPQVIIFGLFGAGIMHGDKYQTLMSIGLALISLLLGFYLYRKKASLYTSKES